MDDADAVGARWVRGLEEAAQRAYGRAHGVEIASIGSASRPGPGRWRVAPRTAATAAIAVALLGATAWWGLRPEGPVPLPSPSASATAAAGPSVPAVVLLVHVSGAVKEPGLVELAGGARVIDAVEAAGGLDGVADEASVNLARPVQDGEHVVVGALGEGTEDHRVDLNRAQTSELETLAGIGPAIAARIVADREANGPFASVEDLGRVSGVGPAILAGIVDSAKVG